MPPKVSYSLICLGGVLYICAQLSYSPIFVLEASSIFILNLLALRSVSGKVSLLSGAFYSPDLGDSAVAAPACAATSPFRRAHHTLSGGWTMETVQIPSIGVSDRDTLAWGQLTLGSQRFFVFTKGVLSGKGFQRSLFGSCALGKQLDRGIWADFTLWHDAKKGQEVLSLTRTRRFCV